MTGRSFLDTNVLVYLFDISEPTKQKQARRLFEHIGRESPVLSTQVLSEFYVVTTRKLAEPLDPTTAAEAVRHFTKFQVVSVDRNLVSGAITTSQQAGISHWDALIVEAAASAACETLLTEDLADGRIIRGVRIVNPFQSLRAEHHNQQPE